MIQVILVTLLQALKITGGKKSTKGKSSSKTTKKSTKVSPKKKSKDSPKKKSKDSPKKKSKDSPKRKSKKSKKDPNAPKKALSAYMYYASSRRNDWKKEGGANASLKVTEQTKIFGAEWQKLSEKEKAPFIEKNAQDKKRYDKEMKSYTPPEKDSDESSDDAPQKKKKAKKDPNAPKKATTAFMQFSNELRPKIRAQHPEMKMTEVAVELGKRWKVLSDADKKPYVALAEEDKERYTKEQETYLADGKK